MKIFWNLWVGICRKSVEKSAETTRDMMHETIGQDERSSMIYPKGYFVAVCYWGHGPVKIVSFPIKDGDVQQLWLCLYNYQWGSHFNWETEQKIPRYRLLKPTHEMGTLLTECYSMMIWAMNYLIHPSGVLNITISNGKTHDFDWAMASIANCNKIPKG